MSLNLDNLRCLLLPVGSRQLLMPNSCVAEVITYQEAQPVPGAPEWLLGLLPWRNQMIPTITFETLVHNEEATIGRRSRLAVMKAFAHRREMPFYAVVTQGFPRLMQLNRDGVQLADSKEENKFISSYVSVSGVTAELPDVDALEDILVARGGAIMG